MAIPLAAFHRAVLIMAGSETVKYTGGCGEPKVIRSLPQRPRKYTAGRNDPCPCGSGKKFKKCCYERPVQ